MTSKIKDLYPKYDNKDPGNRRRLARILKEMKAGFEFLDSFRNDRVATIFGSAQTKPNDLMYQRARQLGRRLAEEGITVMTGGGPGIMEAANRGAYDVGGRSAGLNIILESTLQERRNHYIQESEVFNYFFVRKLMLAYAGQAYVYFPGGFGTLDEFYEISTLVSTKKIHEQLPIVLFGKSYWNSLFSWIKKTVITDYKVLTNDKLRFFSITDDVEEAFDIIKTIPKRIPRSEQV